ncbi:MAG: hypothetical protein LH702_29725 [Phormidesmis sp. CAN_BIN44]|nr:hypothetical protein [Phormidesmis sp. CAN_BIN44]
MQLPTSKVSGDSLQGYEVPDVGSAALKYLDSEHVFRAKKKGKHLWGNQELYSAWDGAPRYYDWCG